MNKLRKIFLSLIIVFVCVLGFTFNVKAEDASPGTNNSAVANKKYPFISGENQKYTVGTTSELKVEIAADNTLFGNVYVNGKVLDASAYTVSGGRTSVVLKKSYLDTLNNGIHTLKVTFSDGGYSETEFAVEKTITNPSTGIGITNGVLIVFLILGGLYLLVRKQSKFPKHN